tara:strand:+ start:301 stop:1188 length:888 start_codon:yes stop_codon:yes gene_type:complete
MMDNLKEIKKVTKPDWLKVKIKLNKNYRQVSQLVSEHSLNTVCEEARCPNIYECWDAKTATIMILGDICTRMCGFCSVKTGKPDQIDKEEPLRVANAVKKMGLEHIVITSVDRDDLKNDYGASIWAETIKQINNLVPNCSVEVLTPDFKAHEPSVNKVLKAKPDIFSHNVETVRRISKLVRPNSDWDRTKKVLQLSIESGLVTKTGLMVGLGETDEEVLETMVIMSDIGINIFNIGQYLQPTKNHLPVQRYVHPDLFEYYKNEGYKLGFKVVESGPLVRSSYHAASQSRKFNGYN